MTETRQLAYRHEFEASDQKADAAVDAADSATQTAESAVQVADAASDTADGAVQTADAALVEAGLARADAAAAREGAGAGVVGYTTRTELYADLDHDAGTIAYVTLDPTAANNGRYLKVGASGSGSWSQSSRGWAEEDVEGLIGGANVSAQTLIQWAESESYEPTSINRNPDGVVTSATVRWPDGSSGTLTATTINPTWLSIDAFTITHAASGRSVTQAAVTRDPQSGAVTAKPALSIT